MLKILVLGASGMLGHKVFEVLSSNKAYDTYGTVTKKASFKNKLPTKFSDKVIEGIYADKIDTVENLLIERRPDVVINCIGVIKQNGDSKNTKNCIVLNALFPQQVAEICEQINCRFITIATDCVFDGQKGTAYLDDDLPTCHDVYGMTKYLGEIRNGNALTLRTSIIGHELSSNLSLLDWFLSQNTKNTKGFTKAIFSGFPTVIFAKLLAEKIIPNKDLKGFYHISVNPISKYELLSLVAKIYHKKINIIKDSNLSINRSLNSDKLRQIIAYQPPSWEELIKNMYEDFCYSEFYIEKRKNYEQSNHF